MGILKKYANSAAVEEALDKGVAAYSQAEENRTDILSVEEEIDGVKEEVYEISNNVESDIVTGFYLRQDGTIGIDDSLNIIVTPCKPNTKYVIKAEGDMLYSLRAGACDKPTKADMLLNNFQSTTADKTIILKTGISDTYLYVYCGQQELPITINEMVNKIDFSYNYLANGVFNLDCKMERGGLRSGDMTITEVVHTSEERTAFLISLNGANKIEVHGVDSTICESINCYFYDENGTFISGEEKTASSYVTFDVVENAKYTRLSLFKINIFVKDISLKLIGCTTPPTLVKNTKSSNATMCATIDVENDLCTFVRFILPPNYSINGNKVPLILWMDGTQSHMTTWGGDFQALKLPYLQYLVDEGFAVISVFGWGNKLLSKYPNCRLNYPYVTPTNLACVKAGIEWICDRYNIDYNNIHVMSKSQGGKLATYFATNPIFPIKSIGMFAPVNDFLSQQGGSPTYNDVRRAIADDMNFSGDISPWLAEGARLFDADVRNYLYENIEKVCGMNEAWTGLVGGTMESRFNDALSDCEKYWTEQYWENTDRTDIYTHTDYAKIGKVPVTIWGAKDDNQTPYLKMVEIVKQLQNGGTEAHMRTFNTGGHSVADTSNKVVESVTTKLGIVHTNVPIGWVENIAWIRSKIPSELT